MPNKLLKLKAIAIVLTMVCLTACSNADREKNDRLFKAMDEELTNARFYIEAGTASDQMKMQSNLTNPGTRDFTQIWQPKALVVSQLSKEVQQYMEAMKVDIIKGNNNQVVEDVVIKQGRGEKLYAKLLQYKEDVLKIDSNINNEFRSYFTIVDTSFDKVVGTKQFTDTFFTKVSPAAAMAVLSKFQNIVAQRENGIVHFCLKKSSFDFNSCGYVLYDNPIAFLSSSHVRPNEAIEVTAGIGNFSSRAKAVSINGRPIGISPEGNFVATIKASDKAGKHIVPIRINYVNGDLKEAVLVRQLVYYVDSVASKP